MNFLDKFCIIYLNNIFIFNKILEKYKCHIKKILKILNKIDIILNLSKCKFFVVKIRFLEYIINKNEIHLDSHNIFKILE